MKTLVSIDNLINAVFQVTKFWIVRLPIFCPVCCTSVMKLGKELKIVCVCVYEGRELIYHISGAILESILHAISYNPPNKPIK